MSLPTRKVTVEATVFVSVCEVCGEEELTRIHKLKPSQQPGKDPPPMASWACDFPTHGEVVVNDSRPHGDDCPKRSWRLCDQHAQIMKKRIAAVIAEER